MDKIKELIKYIKESKRTVIFTGAGVSTPSGLQDFRSKDGIYQDTPYIYRRRRIGREESLLQRCSNR